MIVVDTSVAVAALLGHRAARAALVDQRLLAPAHIDAEVTHALRGLVLGGRVSEEQGRALLATWQRLELDRLPVVGLLPRVWDLRDNLTVYDALFVAAAELHDVTLVTADRRLAMAPGPACSIQLIPA